MEYNTELISYDLLITFVNKLLFGFVGALAANMMFLKDNLNVAAKKMGDTEVNNFCIYMITCFGSS